MAAQASEYFYGAKTGAEKAKAFIEDIDVRTELLQLSVELTERAKKNDFRRHLKGPAEKWYWHLSEQLQEGTWADLKAAFLSEYGTAKQAVVSIVEFLETVQGVTQAGRPIAHYVRETERVYEDCPEFLAGLDDRVKAREALVFLNVEKWSLFPKAKEAVIKAYGMDDGPSPFDRLFKAYADPYPRYPYYPAPLFPPPSMPNAASPYGYPTLYPPHYPAPYPEPWAAAYPPSYDLYPMFPGEPVPSDYQGYPQGSQTQEYRPRQEDRRDERRNKQKGDRREDRWDGRRDDRWNKGRNNRKDDRWKDRRDERRNDRKDDRRENGKTFYRGIYCHNCTEEGHYSSTCERPKCFLPQRNINRIAIKEKQAGLSPVAAAVNVAFLHKDWKPRTSPVGRPGTLPVTPSTVRPVAPSVALDFMDAVDTASPAGAALSEETTGTDILPHQTYQLFAPGTPRCQFGENPRPMTLPGLLPVTLPQALPMTADAVAAKLPSWSLWPVCELPSVEDIMESACKMMSGGWLGNANVASISKNLEPGKPPVDASTISSNDTFDSVGDDFSLADSDAGSITSAYDDVGDSPGAGGPPNPPVSEPLHLPASEPPHFQASEPTHHLADEPPHLPASEPPYLPVCELLHSSVCAPPDPMATDPSSAVGPSSTVGLSDTSLSSGTVESQSTANAAENLLHRTDKSFAPGTPRRQFDFGGGETERQDCKPGVFDDQLALGMYGLRGRGVRKTADEGGSKTFDFRGTDQSECEHGFGDDKHVSGASVLGISSLVRVAAKVAGEIFDPC
ncbi:hypothetical protein MMC07_009579 [Pseudocyphellaria aurata]|nr:hypothetical protein [Pseudocyphellaria aurata]